MNERPIEKPAKKAPIALLTRSLIWVCLSLAFLILNVARIITAQAAGRTAGFWVYLQGAIWLVALVMWSYTGWKQLELRKAQRKVS